MKKKIRVLIHKLRKSLKISCVQMHTILKLTDKLQADLSTIKRI